MFLKIKKNSLLCQTDLNQQPLTVSYFTCELLAYVSNNPIKVIPFNCIAHPFYASFFAWLARAVARARSELHRFCVEDEQFREITGRFLLNELGDPHFLMHKFKWHTVEYNILRFQEKLKILLWDIFI